MPTAFARAQQRVNRAVARTLANALATFNGGQPFPVLFDEPFAAPFDGQVDSTAPACTGLAEHLAGLDRGAAITINGKSYRVDMAQPDGTGMVRLTLFEGV